MFLDHLRGRRYLAYPAGAMKTRTMPATFALVLTLLITPASGAVAQVAKPWTPALEAEASEAPAQELDGQDAVLGPSGLLATISLPADYDGATRMLLVSIAPEVPVTGMPIAMPAII